MVRMALMMTTALATVVLSAAHAATRPKRPAPRPVPVEAATPLPSAAVTPGGMMTPKEVKLRATTPAEAEANAIWSTRAGLNIAALQCQFSPFLATVRNYNDFLRQHGDELDRARETMLAHFKRYDGTQAQNSFDRYTTQTYNSYSTLDAQYAFCDEAGRAGRSALTVRKGDLGRRAGALRDQMRAALIPVSALALLQPVALAPETLPPL